mmetsp:Transcript_5442/g.10441  ORF Transcript_5442/g.10441 Transcript_5442/m.10441 type:complete len:818 (+) Transcript_5442:101-2554(+)
MTSSIVVQFVLYLASFGVASVHAKGSSHGHHEQAHIMSASNYDHSLPLPLHTVTLQHTPVHHRSHHRELATKPNNLELTPLYPGYGTHFTFLYVGTPAVRQAAIIDTGSSFTAFPCTGCNKCGKHVNPYFNPKKSSTSTIPRCGKNNKDTCKINEHYSEGSSWEAYTVKDNVYIGGNTPTVVPNGPSYTVPYNFGCMTSVTGLFETQLADGIIGLSRNAQSLPMVLKKQNITKSSTFSLCLETGNGILTLGGVDQSIHKKRDKVQYAKLVPNTEFWTVKISSIKLGDDSVSDIKKLNKGGVIFDSGSTDSVFPTAVKPVFTKLIPELNKLDKENRFICKRDLFKTLPPVVIELFGVGGTATDPKPVQFVISPTQYLSKVSGATNTYEMSIFFDDAGGVVLGANAMSERNTIFDDKNQRVGFVAAKCRFEDYVYEEDPVLTLPPTAAPKDGESTNAHKRCENSAYSSCSAKCSRESPRVSYQVNGTQYFDCESDETKPCVEYCSRSNQVQRGVNPTCLNTFWTECSSDCTQSRAVATIDKKGRCSHKEESRTCYIDQCPTKDGDILIFSDAMFFYKSDINEDRPWSKLYEEDIVRALSILFKIMPGNIDILVDPESSRTEPWSGTKLQFQVYLKLTDFLGSETKLYRKAEQIRKMLNSIDIGSWIIAELSRICDELDGDRISRYSYLFSFDFEVKRSVVLPIGDKRDPTENLRSTVTTDEAYKQQLLVYFLIGGIVAIALLACVIIGVHYRLRADYALLAKDKVLTGGRLAKSIWNRLKKKRGGGNSSSARKQPDPLPETRGLMSTGIHDDDDLNEFM